MRAPGADVKLWAGCFLRETPGEGISVPPQALETASFPDTAPFPVSSQQCSLCDPCERSSEGWKSS